MPRLAVPLAAAAMIAGCGGGQNAGPRSAHPAQAPAHLARARGQVAGPRVSAPASSATQRTRGSRATPCITRRGYGGLGGKLETFAANNNGVSGPAEPTPGSTWYQVIATRRGCVTAYSVQEGARPPIDSRAMLALSSHGYLPADARPVARRRSCAVWRSAALKRAVGLPYVTARAAGQVGSEPAVAQLYAAPHPGC